MARKKVIESNIDQAASILEPAEEAHISAFGTALDEFLMTKYGGYIAPQPMLTPTGIRHLDALLGGGIASNAPVMISSTPETGKSTFAYQFSKTFQMLYPNSIIVYVDIEGSGNTSNGAVFKLSRIETFGLDIKRFMYKPLKMTLDQVFELFIDLIEAKIKFEQKLNKSINMMFVWDSLAATPDGRIHTVDDPNKMIGKRAATISFLLNKNSHLFAFHRVTFLIIDQVRAHFKIDPYAASEQSVGVFKDFKAATGIMTLHHTTSQWLYLSKRAAINPGKDNIDISGWYLDITTEKNKHAPSKITVTCLFDKIRGIDKYWSEYWFLSHLTPTEEKLGEKNITFPTVIKTSGAYSYIEFTNPENGEKFTSDKFFKSQSKKLYETDENFRTMFDYVMDLSVNMRIKNGIFRMPEILEVQDSEDSYQPEDQLDESISEIETETEVENESSVI